MAGTSVGGVNVFIGLNTEALKGGVQDAGTTIKALVADLARIKLTGVVKGDPFGETKNYMKEARKKIEDVFSEFKSQVKGIDVVFSKHAEKSRKNAEGIIKTWIRLKEVLKDVSKVSKVSLLSKEDMRTGGFMPSDKVSIKKFFGAEDLEGLKSAIQAVNITANKGGKKIADSLIKGLKTNIKVRRKDLESTIKQLFAHLPKEAELGKISKEMVIELNKAFKLQAKLEDREALRRAKSASNIRAERVERVKKHRLALARLRKEASMGIRVDENRRQMHQKLNLLNKEGIKLHKREALEISKLRIQYEKLNKTQKSSGFFQPGWFKERARWFVQLRLYWGAYRTLSSAIRDLVTYEDQLARALRTANSEFMTQKEIAQAYADTMRDMAAEHGATWEDIGETLYQLTSAGLSSEEALAGVNTALSLVIALEGDARDTTKMLAGIYNNFADTITHVTTQEEKLAYIGDVIAQLWKTHQMELSEYTDAMKYASATAKMLGMNFDQVSVIMAMLHQHMIRGGQAGRGFQAVMARMTQNANEFANMFGIEAKIKGGGFLNIIDVFKELNKQMKSGKLTVDEIGAVFERMGRRGAPTFKMMVEFYDEWANKEEQLADIIGGLRKLEEDRLSSLTRRWRLFIGELKRYTTTLLPALKATGFFLDAMRTKMSVGRVGKELREFYKKPKGLLGRFKEPEFDRPSAEEKMRRDPEFARDVKKVVEYLQSRRIDEGRLFTLDQQTLDRGREYLAIQSQITAYKIEQIKQEEKKAGIEKKDIPDPREFEYQYRWQSNLLTIEQKIAEMRKEIIRLNDIEIKQREDLEGRDSVAGREKQSKRLITTARKRVAVERALARLVKEQSKPEQDRIKGLIKELNLKKDILQQEVQAFNFKIKEVSEGPYDKEKHDKIVGFMIDIAERERNIAKINKEITVLKLKTTDVLYPKHIELAKEILKLEKEVATEKYHAGLSDAEQKLIAFKRRLVAVETEEKLNDLADERFKVEKQSGDNALTLIDIDKRAAQLQKEKAKQYLKLTEDELERMRLYERIRGYNREIYRLELKRFRLLHPFYDAFLKIEGSIKSAKEMWSHIIEMTGRGIGTGLGKILTDITGLFQEQRQEVAELEKEIEDLQKEYEEALSEGNVERAESINNEIERLGQEINDLEDPLKNISKAFTEFFKDLIDNIRAAINEWIAMQVVMGIMKGIGRGIGLPITSGPTLLPAAHGGVLPQIEAFKTFSSGGITGRPTLAVLGDNPSKKEIVLPEENIQSNNVSGFVRDSEQPINIVNVLSEEDVVYAMAGTTGQRVIVNTMGKDLRDRGPFFRQVRR